MPTIDQGGNSFGTAMNIGTNDGYSLNFWTNGTLKAYFDVPTANFYVVALANQNTVNNSRVWLSNTGTVITRNVADGNVPLTVNSAAGTGAIQNWNQAGTPVAFMHLNGVLYGSGLSNGANVNNAFIEPKSTGTTISRNIADFNPVLKVNQLNASSTGNTLTLQKAGSDQLSMSSSGILKVNNLAGTGTRMVSADSTGALSASSTEFTSNSYSPTFNGTAASYSAAGFRFIRIGNIVQGSGAVEITGANIGLNTFDFDLPISTFFIDIYRLTGVVSGVNVGAPSTSGESNHIQAGNGLTTAVGAVSFIAIDTDVTVYVQFTYTV